MKCCSHCRIEKPFEEFHQGGGPDGLHRQCKLCRSPLDATARETRRVSRNEKRELLTQGLRRCSQCRDIKEVGDFYAAPRNQDGLSGKCIPCYNAGVAEYSARPRTKALRAEQHRRLRARDEEAWQARQRSHRFRYLYGIELEHYEAMLEAQQGRCWICQTMATPDLTLAVDHDHDTGQVRGLLCRRCNTGLGMFRDDSELMQRALSYLVEAAPVQVQAEAPS